MEVRLHAARLNPAPLAALIISLLAAAVIFADEPEYYDSIQYLTTDCDWDDDTFVYIDGRKCSPSYCDQLSADIACTSKSMAAQGIVYSPELTQFRQRVAASYHLGPLDAHETAAYIDFRLGRAAAARHHSRNVDDRTHVRAPPRPAWARFRDA